ncbi:phospholipase, PLC-D [Aspergillus steynii IBT 23096]|uniref:Phospholipase, PLC-D n=1 Tax=Aspergillus steynii IBT 23096 TaxID=1392250 RepID=A0A2I2GJH6_9EURO|nr:phospholipase, PLC-D [Aspergillus steynii IBT 23096]PLB53033.1 phospholipase, PLC-D [Aspergillus steynii IBT 23096]
MKSNAILLSALVASASALPHKQQDEVWKNLRSNIKHVVYLMMENHSFDNIAGYWDFHPDIDNLRNVTYCNEYTNPNWTVWDEPLDICAGPFETEVPLADPDHEFAGVTYQIYRKWDVTNDDVPNMAGFIERQSEKYSATPGEASFVIKAYNEKKSETLAELAKNFAFWDSYFAEHPGPTNPNRQFATSGSTCGHLDNNNQAAGFYNNVTGTTCATSIFESLSNRGISWKNYYETDIVDGWMYKWVQDNAVDRLAHASDFYQDLEEGTLPTFSYINPECCTIDSMHPKSNMAAGEQLIKHVYDAVRKSKYWDNVLIIINFDEHGGFADHVPPPANVPRPDDQIMFEGESEGHYISYDFTRLGVRVPAFLISPYIEPNTLIHDQGTMYAEDSAYTHSSILHFLQELWGLEGLNNRVQWAKTFEHVFSSKKRSDTPKSLTTPVWYGGSWEPKPEPFYLLNQDESYYANL